MTAEPSWKTRTIVRERATPIGHSLPLCEAMVSPACEYQAAEIHHRAGRGKSKRLRSASALLYLCGACHRHITQHYCFDAGYSVHRLRELDPADVPVSYRGGALVWLVADGSLVPVEDGARVSRYPAGVQIDFADDTPRHYAPAESWRERERRAGDRRRRRQRAKRRVATREQGPP